METLVERRRYSKRRPLTQNLMIYIAPVVRRVIGVQYVLREEKKVVLVEEIEADQQIWLWSHLNQWEIIEKLEWCGRQ